MAVKTVFAVAVLATGLLTAGAQAAARRAPAAPDGAVSVERGHRLAQRNCVQCHAIGPTGESPNPASPLFRELYKRYPAGALEEAFGNGLLTRHPAMPEIRLLPGEIADLTAYLKSLQSRSEARAGANRITG